MRTAMDVPIDALDAEEREFVEQVREHGWFDTQVTADNEGPGFCYTSGIWLRSERPELLMFGMKPEIVHNVFWDIFRDFDAGKTLPTGKRTPQVFGNADAFLFEVGKRFYANYLGWSRWFYGGDEFPCLQIVWPDRDGLFPWEPGFDSSLSESQPDVTERGWLAELAH